MSPTRNQSSAKAGIQPKRHELTFTPNTAERSLLHWLVAYDPQKWGRNVSVYAVAVAGTYGLMALATQIYPHDAPALPLLRDWPVAFAFWISLPAVLFLVASDQLALEQAMNRVEKAGIVTSDEESAREFKLEWTRNFRLINIRLQTAALLLAPLLSYLTFRSYKAGDTVTWAQASTPNEYAYLWGIAVFYAVLIFYIGRGVALAVLLKGVANKWEIRLTPLHPDGCGGLRPLGRIGLRNQYALTILGINIAVLAATVSRIESSLVPVIIIPATVLYLVFGPIIFLGPLLPFRRVMGDRRRALMEEIAEPLDAKFQSLKAQARAHRDIDKDDVEAMDRLRLLGKAVGDLPIWPFDARTMRVFTTAYVIPVLVALASKLGSFIVESATN